ncbi:MAG: hypothetical protein JWM68_1498 [Verrucomicrobiales bacterium]|nr:hypothetical protein [Verrucomicrobiales bacterium]
MLISAPPSQEHPAILADWLELQALASDNRNARVLSVSDVYDITQDTEEEDVGDFDAQSDDLVARVTAEIQRRIVALREAYPFQINDSGTILTWGPEATLGRTVYLFCLMICHVTHSALFENEDLTAEARDGRNLFQVCATIASAGLVHGPSYSFGWPRLDGTGFAEKLAQIYNAFGDGKVRDKPLAAAPPAKDDGIDVISWRHQPDGLPSTFYVLGQVASGLNWREKTVLKDIERFHWAWFEIAPASPVSGAMFVPFCITDTPAVGGDYDEQDFLVNRLQFIAKEFGLFIYRYRLPLLAHQAEALSQLGAYEVEGIREIGRVADWNDAFIGRLRGAALR